jgi:hypothetical protein
MSNHLKHIAVKNYYYSGKTFGSTSTHNIHLNMHYSGNGFICNTTAYLYASIGFELLL